jgi:hypothetical protein
MPNPNAIVSSRIRFDPPLEGRDVGQALAAEGGLSVDLGGDRRVRLDPGDERSVGFATVLDQLAGMGLPAYLELDPAAGSIDRLLIPTLGRVLSVATRDGGGVEVMLDRSHARHVVPGDSPDLEVLERDLRAALDSKRPILLVEDFARRVIDVRDFTPDPEGPRPPLPEPGDEPLPLPWRPRRWWEWVVLWPLRRLWWWLCYPWWWWHCPSATRAQTIFDAMAATTCDPLTVPAPCIPFKYPYDGCWARANEMCRLMVALGRDPAKVWIDGNLDAYSANAIGCHVYWGWHVAPTLCVRGPWPWLTRRMVIDPSLFTTPVTEAQWKAAQGDPNATLTHTSRDIFIRPPFTPLHDDASYTQTKADLAYYRLQLYNESISNGPPPYCP